MAASDSFVGEHLNPSPYKEALARAELAEAALREASRQPKPSLLDRWAMAALPGVIVETAMRDRAERPRTSRDVVRIAYEYAREAMKVRDAENARC